MGLRERRRGFGVALALTAALLCPHAALAQSAANAPTDALPADALYVPASETAATLGDQLDARLFGDFRIRYENAADSAHPETGRAATARLRTGLEIAPHRSLSLLAEFEGNLRLAGVYDDLINDNDDRAVIVDPEFAELNRLAARIEPWRDAALTIGRQYLSFDDERFVGKVAFRQNDQTFDAARFSVSLPNGGEADAVYLWRTNRILSGRNDEGRFRGDSYLFNASAPLLAGRLTGFHYALDLGTVPVVASGDAASSQTTGFRYEGRAPWPRASTQSGHLKWEASYARQRDYAGAPARYRANYWLGAVSAEGERFSLGARFEILGADSAGAFQTPLATLHAFQGAADVFVITPAAGVRERSLYFEWRAGQIGPFRGVALAVSGLSFQSASSNTNFGREFDASLRASLAGATLSAKVADYAAKSFGSDVRRVWITVERAF